MEETTPDPGRPYPSARHHPVSESTGMRVEEGIDLFTEGDSVFEAMADDIRRASSSVRMETYILADDEVGRRFMDLLGESAERGVRVKLRVDSAGSFFFLPTKPVRELRRRGVQFRWCRRWQWRRPWAFNHRNHRKLLVVDRSVAYLGGFNLHRDCSQAAVGNEAWRDAHVRLTGDLARHAAEVYDAYAKGDSPPRTRRSGRYYLVSSNALRRRLAMRRLFEHAFSRARRRIWLTTPYFVPDAHTQRQLREAAERGVDVRVITPIKTDVRLTQWAARAAYSGLLAAGVRIFEYQPRLLHAKTVVVDSHWSTIGTANLDYRSLFTNDEVNLVSRSPAMNRVLSDVYRNCLADAEELHHRPWYARGIRPRIAEFVGWLARRWL